MSKSGNTPLAAPIRPTRQRLYAALGISAIFIAVMLALFGSLVEFGGPASVSELEGRDDLSVLIRTRDEQAAGESLKENVTEPQPPRPAAVSADPVDRPRRVASPSAPGPLPEPQPVRDWHAIAKSVARTSVDDYFRNEDSRASLWRETHSLMFEPVSAFVPREEEPVLPDLRFRPQIHVVGLGVTIGSCFIGIPLAGVPVEQRTVAINLFVCAREPDEPLG